MSELQRSFAKSKLAGLPFEPPLPINDLLEDEELEGLDDLKPLPESTPDDDSSSASSASSASSTGTIRPSPSKHLFARSKGASVTASKRTTDPLPWNDYFHRELYLENKKSRERLVHHAYISPLIEKGPLVVCHHGAGSSGLSFALFALELRKILPNCGVLSPDAREHGETTCERYEDSPKDGDLNLTLENLCEDLFDVIQLTRREMEWDHFPGVFLVGHSLGGAVVTELAKSLRLGHDLLGYAVLDVVEGSAMDALQSMQQYLLTRPATFPSIPAAIEWHIRSRTIRSSTSARISVPSLLRWTTLPVAPGEKTRLLEWRTDLAKTEPFWSGWFTGLSGKFLSARGGKLLILAGTDRLDKELMIGQMQGKYQLQVFPEAGHFVHEDSAEKTAIVFAEFIRRNDGSGLVLPPKVGSQLPKV